MGITPQDLLRDQYRDSSNLAARVELHDRFSTNRYGWHPWVFDQLPATPGQRILEIGCGPGYLWQKNLTRVPTDWAVTLSDLSIGMVGEARRNLPGQHQFRGVAANVQQLPFADSSFDTVIANHMLYHVADRAGALREMPRVLRSGGRLFASTIGQHHLREISSLVRRVAPDWVSWATAEGDPASFTLENGTDQVGRSFPNVELRRYDDALVVTEARPLIAYILSGSAKSALDRGRVQALTELVESQLARHGSIQITKDSGLFVAW